jgi:hypothetical protein
MPRWEHGLAICSELKEHTANEPNVISTVISDDESWVYGNYPELIQHSSRWTAPNYWQPRERHKIKTM